MADSILTQWSQRFAELASWVAPDSDPKTATSPENFPPRATLNPEPDDRSVDFRYSTFETRLKGPEPWNLSKKEVTDQDHWQKLDFPVHGGALQWKESYQGSPLMQSRMLAAKYFCSDARTVMEIPRLVFTDAQVQEFARITQELNQYAHAPLQKVRFVLAENNTGSFGNPIGYYESSTHAVYLSHSLMRANDNIGLWKSSLVHEIGHGMDGPEAAFSSSPEWKLIFEGGLNGSLFNLLVDWHYDSERTNMGHPFDNPEEFFASAVTAYYLNADEFALRIQNADSPEMRAFGMAVWCYLRDEVFREPGSPHGKVFTSDGKDPFADFPLEKYLGNLRLQGPKLLWSPLSDWGSNAQTGAALFLGDLSDKASFNYLKKTVLNPRSNAIDIANALGALFMLGMVSPEESKARFLKETRAKDPYVRQQAWTVVLASIQWDSKGDYARKNLPLLFRAVKSGPESVKFQAAYVLATYDWGDAKRRVEAFMKTQLKKRPKAESSRVFKGYFKPTVKSWEVGLNLVNHADYKVASYYRHQLLHRPTQDLLQEIDHVMSTPGKILDQYLWINALGGMLAEAEGYRQRGVKDNESSRNPVAEQRDSFFYKALDQLLWLDPVIGSFAETIMDRQAEVKEDKAVQQDPVFNLEVVYAEKIKDYSEALRQLLKHPRVKLRLAALGTIANIQTSVELEGNAVALMDSLQDAHPTVRYSAAFALMSKSWGAETESVKLALHDLHDDEDLDVRRLIQNWRNPRVPLGEASQNQGLGVGF